MSDAPVLGGVNLVADLDAVTDFERKHTPYITSEPADGRTRISVKVGHYVSHPNAADHHIEWVTLYVGDAPIAHFDFAAVVAYPEVSIVVDLEPGTIVRAVESCNTHGLWAAEMAM
ncbi:MAG: desulfoferrodoxin family protein [Actinomycetota bacterium]|nr:desulfoferrodoxin family protein [Actinomycetota bacterium]